MTAHDSRWGRPVFWRTLIYVVVSVVALVGVIQVVGNDMGENCQDSYSCRGFLISGAECLDDNGEHYCSRYCERDDDCPLQWACGEAVPTALTIKTGFLDSICLKPR